MRRSTLKLFLALGAALIVTVMFTACATMGPPRPPSLELPKPPSDLRATRKSDRVILTWTVPSVTTDRGTIRKLGPTRICRGPETKLTQCGAAVGEAAAQKISGPTEWSKEKVGSLTPIRCPGSWRATTPP